MTRHEARARRADLVTRMLDRLRQLQPGITEASACELERQLRTEFGGCEAYVGKKPKAGMDKVRAMAPGRDIADIAQAAGVSPRTIYRRISDQQKF